MHWRRLTTVLMWARLIRQSCDASSHCSPFDCDRTAKCDVSTQCHSSVHAESHQGSQLISWKIRTLSPAASMSLCTALLLDCLNISTCLRHINLNGKASAICAVTKHLRPTALLHYDTYLFVEDRYENFSEVSHSQQLQNILKRRYELLRAEFQVHLMV